MTTIAHCHAEQLSYFSTFALKSIGKRGNHQTMEIKQQHGQSSANKGGRLAIRSSKLNKNLRKKDSFCEPVKGVDINAICSLSPFMPLMNVTESLKYRQLPRLRERGGKTRIRNPNLPSLSPARRITLIQSSHNRTTCNPYLVCIAVRLGVLVTRI